MNYICGVYNSDLVLVYVIFHTTYFDGQNLRQAKAKTPADGSKLRRSALLPGTA